MSVEQNSAAIQAKFQQALASYQRGELDQADRLCREILADAPDCVDALHLSGIIACQKNDAEAGVKFISQAIGLNPGDAFTHSSLGNALAELARHEEALASYDRALALNPGFAQAIYNRGNTLGHLGRHEEALAGYDRALAIVPDFPQAHYNRGNTLGHLNRHEESLASYNRALAIVPDFAEALTNRGAALARLNRYEEALASFDRVLTLRPDDIESLNNRGDALGHLKRYPEALPCFDRALVLRPDYIDALYNRATTLRDLKRYDDAAAAFARVLELAPDFPFLKGELLHSKMLCCEWNGIGPLLQSIEMDVRAGKQSAEPFGFQGISSSAGDLKRCAEIYAADKFPPQSALWTGERYNNTKIRIGYVSGELRQQAMGVLMTGLFESHDKNRFEVFAFDNGIDDGSKLRQRINKAFDKIVDITRLSDRDAATAIKQGQLDILININGYFGEIRQGIFALRPCPIQVNYLGFPGTIGAEYIDYIIADNRVIPPAHQIHYTEKVVYLPDSYQVNDSKRPIAEYTPTRAEAGLPERGFVFCCFNNNYKITPEMFEVWMRLLKGVEGSVLWLLEDNGVAARNLRREAQARSVAPERLVFAPRMKHDEHLARHRLADLFVDSLPYNAHTTASDALWAGLPVLTCVGTAFPGRVGASLLDAVGLPELITHSLEDYEALALKLATSPDLLADIKAKLARNRTTCPLFDTRRFTRHLDSAFITMWERHQRGEPPVSFTVKSVEA